MYQGVRYRFGIPEHAAVKVIWDAESAGPAALGRFRREVAAVMDLDDPGVTRVLAADLACRPAWFATELVPGSSLQSEVTRTGPLGRARWLTLAVLLLSTLDRIHAYGIIHRDLKPPGTAGRHEPVGSRWERRLRVSRPNAAGQLGSAGGDADAPRAVETGGVLADARLIRIAVGAEHACAVDDRGRAYCWGSNGRGQLGVGDAVAGSEVPVSVDTSGVLSGKRLVLIGAAADTSCALDDTGTLYCWGANDRGQMGNGTSTGTARPIAVDITGALRARTIRRFSIGGQHACAVDDRGSAYCWGANEHGQLGIGTTEDSSVPVPVAGIDAIPRGGYESITVGGASTCGWSRDGVVACWGANGSGQLGIATTTDSYIPRRVDFDPPLSGYGPFGIRTGGSTVCLAGSGEVTRCWGANGSGQLGDGSTRDSGVPVQLTGAVPGADPPPLVHVGVGTRTSCGSSGDGRMWCWGSDELDLLGDGPG